MANMTAAELVELACPDGVSGGIDCWGLCDLRSVASADDELRPVAQALLDAAAAESFRGDGLVLDSPHLRLAVAYARLRNLLIDQDDCEERDLGVAFEGLAISALSQAAR